MICQADKCIFVHIPKVAGQSIESVFLQRLGLSWQQRESLLLKHNSNPAFGPPRLAHLTAQEYVKLGYVSAREFKGMFSFAFVRNPWDRLVSEYVYRKYPYSFNDFLFKFFPENSDDNYNNGMDLYRHIIPQTDFLYDNKGKLLVNFVGKFENITDDFSEVTRLITGESLPLPHENKSQSNKLKKLKQVFRFSKSQKKHYSEYYDESSRAFVAQLYRKDIELFGYKFDSAKV